MFSPQFYKNWSRRRTCAHTLAPSADAPRNPDKPGGTRREVSVLSGGPPPTGGRLNEFRQALKKSVCARQARTVGEMNKSDAPSARGMPHKAAGLSLAGLGLGRRQLVPPPDDSSSNEQSGEASEYEELPSPSLLPATDPTDYSQIPGPSTKAPAPCNTGETATMLPGELRSVPVIAPVHLVGGKVPVSYSKERPKNNFKVGRIIVFVHELQHFVQVMERETRDLDWDLSKTMLTDEDRTKWRSATLLIRFHGRKRKQWFKCQLRTFARAEINIRGDYLMETVLKIQALFNAVTSKYGKDFAYTTCRHNFSEHLYGNLTYPNRLIGETSVKNSEVKTSSRVTEAEAEQVFICSVGFKTYIFYPYLYLSPDCRRVQGQGRGSTKVSAR